MEFRREQCDNNESFELLEDWGRCAANLQRDNCKLYYHSGTKIEEWLVIHPKIEMRKSLNWGLRLKRTYLYTIINNEGKMISGSGIIFGKETSTSSKITVMDVRPDKVFGKRCERCSQFNIEPTLSHPKGIKCPTRLRTNTPFEGIVAVETEEEKNDKRREN